MTARDIAAMEEGELAAFESSLQERVRSTLGRSPSIDVDSIDIAVTGDQVLLRGSVPNADQRRLAQEIATTVEGVRSVQNELSVR
jgi:osmotically-inducible protein OsmY